MNLQECLHQLEQLGTSQNKKIYTNHGCDIAMYGVSIANLKQVAKQIKNDKELGKQLFLSSNLDAIYLSQWIVSPSLLTIEEIEHQILLSNYYMLIEYAIPHIVAKDHELANQCLHRWIEHKEPRFRQAAYSLYAILMSIYADDTLNIKDISNILEYIRTHIHQEENRVRYTMNQFVISAGGYLKSLNKQALDVAAEIGNVDVSMGNTACQVPNAKAYIEKMVSRKKIGTKRKV